jgi:hypothetical protein
MICLNVPDATDYRRLMATASDEASRDNLIANVLLALFAVSPIACVITLVLAFSGTAGPTYALFFAVAAVVVQSRHGIARERLRKSRNRVVWYENALDRMDPEWQGDDEESARFAKLIPLGEDQLGLFGAGSLFDRIASCNTEPGRARLAGWLAHAAAPAEVRERQIAVRELAANQSFCTDCGVASMHFGDMGNLEPLSRWLAQEDAPLHKRTRLPLLIAAPLMTLAVGVSFWAGWLPGAIGLPLTAIAGAFHYWLGAGFNIETLGGGVMHLVGLDLQTVTRLVGVVASHDWSSGLLTGTKATILASLVESGTAEALRRGSWLLSLASHDTDIAWLISTFFLLPQIAALRLYEWKQTHGIAAKRGIDAIANLEALVSLGTYAAENNAHSYPTILDAQDGPPVFRAKGLGHPLIAPHVCVPNDIALGDESRYWVISGSNMGGKSTLLRAIGLNIGLAWAGAPVRAESLETSAGAIAASICVGDALGEGQSKFSAEVTRLKKILDYVECSPGAVVLLDEILSGTNTGDRRVAAVEIVRRLAKAKSLGVVTTHDLAVSSGLLTLPGFQPKHFTAEETVEGLLFDYKVRDGVVQGTNGLAVLRMLGIDVGR